MSIDDFGAVSPVVNSSYSTAEFTYTLSHAAGDHATLEIYSATGEPVNKISDLPGNSGTYTVVWDLKNDTGVPVPDGYYCGRLIVGSEDYELMSGFGKLSEPTGVALRNNIVYVVDFNTSTVSIFEPDGTQIASWGEFGTAVGQLNHPFGIAVDPWGNVTVADTYNHRIQQFDIFGNLIGAWGVYGSGNGQFDMPMGIAFDSNGYAYVADANNSRVQKFGPGGNYISSWGTNGSEPGQFYMPMFIATDSAGFVYVADVGNYRVQKFDQNGNYVAGWGSYGYGDGQFTCLGGITIGQGGNVFVVDVGRSDNHNVQEFDPSGNLLGYWSTIDDSQTLPSFPIGIAAGWNDTVYVTDYCTHNVKKFGRDAEAFTSLDVDMSVPITTASLSGTPGWQGWYTSAVIVTLTATDMEPGFATGYSLDNAVWNRYVEPVRLTDGIYTLFYRSFDQAGNVEATRSISFKTDATRPEAAALLSGVQGNNGWYTSNVTVLLSFGDSGGSGLNATQYRIYPEMNWTTYTTPFNITDEGYNTVYFQAWDNAGNNIYRIASVKIDMIAPAITANTPVDSSVYILNQRVLADWSVIDSSSLVAWTYGTTGNNQPIDTASVGLKTYAVLAGDNAGNNASKTIRYSVVYNYGGTLPPISADGTSTFKLGKSVPVEFRLTDAGGSYARNAVARLYLAKIVNGVPGTEIEAMPYGTANTANVFRYDGTSNSYKYLLGTSKLSKGTWELRIKLDDGTIKYAKIKLK